MIPRNMCLSLLACFWALCVKLYSQSSITLIRTAFAKFSKYRWHILEILLLIPHQDYFSKYSSSTQLTIRCREWILVLYSVPKCHHSLPNGKLITNMQTIKLLALWFIHLLLKLFWTEKFTPSSLHF